MSVNKQIDNKWHLCHELPLKKQRRKEFDTLNNMTKSQNIMLSKRYQNHLYIYIKSTDSQSNLWRWKAGQWLPGNKGGGGWGNVQGNHQLSWQYSASC